MNIFIQEFKMNLRSVITWSISVALVLFVYMALFATMIDDMELLNQTLDAFPPELLMAFGMDGMDLSTVLGFFGFAFLFCQICLAIQASNYGFSLVSVEERDMTADFLLAKPVGRLSILTSKFLAAFAGLTLTNLVVWAASLVLVNVYREGREVEYGTLFLILGSVVIFQLFFFTVGLVVSLLVKRIRSVTPYSMGLSIGMYVLGAFGGMLGESKFELITPFKHFEPQYIVNNAAYDLPLVMISVVTIIISVAASYWLYMRRNIHSAT